MPPHRDSYPFIAPARFAGRLAGKVALVTGASHGLGARTARALAAAGCRVACVARTAATLDAAVAEINKRQQASNEEGREEGGGGEAPPYPLAAAIAIPADLTDPAALAAAVRATRQRLGGPVDILVNCAGALRFGPFVAEPDDLRAWRRVLELDLVAPVALARLVLPGMLAERGGRDESGKGGGGAGRGGCIVSFGSVAGVEAAPFCTAYATAKAGLVKFHAELEAEVGGGGGGGVRTWVLHPGEVDTGAARVDGAVNVKALAGEPRMAGLMAAWAEVELAAPELAADTVVALCAEERAGVLSGRFVDAREDLEGLIEAAERERSGAE